MQIEVEGEFIERLHLRIWTKMALLGKQWKIVQSLRRKSYGCTVFTVFQRKTQRFVTITG